MARSKGEKAKCQSGKNKNTKLNQREKANNVKKEKHYRKIIVISACCLYCGGYSQWQEINQHNQFSIIRQQNGENSTYNIYSTDSTFPNV